VLTPRHFWPCLWNSIFLREEKAVVGSHHDIVAVEAIDGVADDIVIENKEPDLDIQQRVKYVHFSGVLGDGRSGFFPTTANDS